MRKSLNTASVSLQCPAKINLHLRVGPRREDGFHSLLSWMCTVGLFDTLSLKVPLESPVPLLTPVSADPQLIGSVDHDAPPGEPGKLAGACRVVQSLGAAGGSDTAGVRLALTCDPPDLPCDHRNLVVRVASSWAAGRGVAIEGHLQKRIPAGAGLGGGSSDAARMILAPQRLWPTPAAADLPALAASVGSDVPFFLAGPSSVCQGRGEIVQAIGRPFPRWAVLILPPIHMPTPDAYRRFDAMGLGRADDLDRQPDWVQWAGLDARSLLQRLVNDLEAPAFGLRPDLAELRARIESGIKQPVRMSGSGSSLFTLYDAPAQAGEAARSVRQIVDDRTRVEAVELAPELSDDLTPPV